MYFITVNHIDSGEYTTDAKTIADFIAENPSPRWNSFRLLDDDKYLYFEGIYNGLKESGDKAFEPLDDFGGSYGCTELQYFENGNWKTL